MPTEEIRDDHGNLLAVAHASAPLPGWAKAVIAQDLRTENPPTSDGEPDMTTTNTLHSQEEILDRIKAVAESDWAGWQREVLVQALTYEHAQPFLVEDAPAGDWPEPTLDRILDMARDYLRFAIGKILHHRGLSAERSTVKLREYAWLLGQDGIVTAMDNTMYPQYGTPKVYTFAVGMGWWGDATAGLTETDRAGLTRMADGYPCHDKCRSGCGQ